MTPPFGRGGAPELLATGLLALWLVAFPYSKVDLRWAQLNVSVFCNLDRPSNSKDWATYILSPFCIFNSKRPQHIKKILTSTIKCCPSEPLYGRGPGDKFWEHNLKVSRWFLGPSDLAHLAAILCSWDVYSPVRQLTTFGQKELYHTPSGWQKLCGGTGAPAEKFGLWRKTFFLLFFFCKK